MELINTPVEPAGAEDGVNNEQSLFRRGQQLGKKVLATAGVIAAFGAAALEAPSVTAAEATHTNSQTYLSDSPPPEDGQLPIAADPGAFETGIATYSWHTEGQEHLFQDMAEAGMSSVRLNIVRDNSGHDLSVFEHELPSIKANGIEPVLLLQQSTHMPIAGYADWAAQVVADTPDVNRYVIDNEPNNPMFWNGTMQQYANMLHQAYVAIHKIRPDAIVSGIGLDSIDQDHPVEWLNHFTAYVDKRWGDPSAVMDTLSVHFYGKPWKIEDRITAIEGLYNGPINIDEAGAIVRGKHYNPEGAVSPALQAEFDTRLIEIAAENVQIRNVFFYRLRNPTSLDDIHAGLETSGGVRLPAFSKVKLMNPLVTNPVDTPIPTGPYAAASG